VYVLREQPVEPTAQARGAVGELASESPFARVELPGSFVERALEPPPALGSESCLERDPPPLARGAQSNIPLVGEEGTAISRAGMRPAR
jgi:hypothetical protein